jgi:cation:H+ antiporter
VPVTVELVAFCLGAAVSLAASYLLVTRLERIGERLGLSEALLGMVAALAADAPEITSAVSALAAHQEKVGAGVIIGSNVFNLAALLGLGALVAGRIGLHRKVVLLGGSVGLWVAVVCLGTTTGSIPPGAGLAAVLAVLLPYLVLLGSGRARLHRLPVARRWADWLTAAIHEEEQELGEVIHPPRGRRRDVVVGGTALIIVVTASVLMERSASSLGAHFGVPQIITGGVVLAAVTSLPNAVAAVYLAARGRGAAMLSTTLNSNTLNVTAGLLLPATIIGLGPPSVHSVLIAVWYLGLTAISMAFTYRDGGVSRATGVLIIGSYLVFLGSLLATAQRSAPGVAGTGVPLLVTGAAWAASLARRPGRRPGPGHRGELAQPAGSTETSAASRS